MSLPPSVSPKIKYLQVFINQDRWTQWRYIDEKDIETEISKSKEKSCNYTTKIFLITSDNLIFDSLRKSASYKSFSIRRTKYQVPQ